jgi:hypothetical protein
VKFFATQIPRNPGSNFRQAFTEQNHAMVLRAIECFSPARVVAVLFATSCIPAYRLDMPVRVRGNPDIGPCWRDGQAPNTLECFGIANKAAGLPVSEVIPNIPDSTNSWLLI